MLTRYIWLTVGVAALLMSAMFAPGTAYAEAGDVAVPDSYGAAMRWYERAAAAGDADAQYLLGERYERGVAGAPDMAQAAHWYAKAAAQGHAEAQFKLGTIYSRGAAVAADASVAAAWYEKAAVQGLAAAQYNFGVALLNGDGVARDTDRAFAWISLAADSGIAPAVALRDRLRQIYPAERIEAADTIAAELRQKYAL